jgi:hypothetical protein
MALPEAPIAHHWLDSTHISFGVATLGVTWRGVRVEGSSFTGRRQIVFFRGESVEKDELFESAPLCHEVFRVTKLSAGYAYELSRIGRIGVGVGGLLSVYALPEELKPAYGANPVSFMLFLRGLVR